MLTLIAAIRAIQAVRIFNLPCIEFGDEAGELSLSKQHVSVCQVVMENHANRVLRFMAEQGFNLKVLSFKPSHKDDRDE
ncbi:hypothetical protein G6011_00123 [Alternaria panax]|uniref:Uncharacterized protein n=1 Tax=Alternaria panax TaxID=48097 RepID=A0AAD4IHM5_9PLEO|nr:hypothetical protein G6011_00123 [Alternaria panax]